MHRRLARAALPALAACIVAGFVRSAPAASFTGALDGVVEELVGRRDNDFTGELTKPEKKQQKAVAAALDLEAEESTSAENDAKVALEMFDKLRKAYRDEFRDVESAKNVALLGGLFDVTFAALGGAAAELQQTERTRVEGLSAGAARKVAAQLDKALDALAASQSLPDRKKRGKSVSKALRFVSKARKLADKDEAQGSGGGATSLTMTIGESVAFTGDGDTTIEIYAANDDLQISSHAVNANGEYYLYVLAHGVTGADTYEADGGTNVEGFLNHFPPGSETGTVYTIVSGSLTLRTYDRRKRFAGSFSFGTRNGGTDLSLSDGEFDITRIERY